MKNKNKNIFYTLLVAIAVILASITISCEEDCDHDINDTINPYIVSYNPVSGVGGVDLSGNLVLTFDGIVVKGEGSITITSDIPQATQVIDVQSDAVTISGVGQIMTINPQDFLSGRDYEIVLDPGFVVDQAGNKYFGMSDQERWTFTSGGNPGDLDAPELVSTMPADDDTEGAITSLMLEFNEDVKTAAGNFVVYDGSGAAVATIDAEGEAVTINGTKISIALATPLDFGTAYYVNFEAGVVKDIGGNSFAGLTDNSSWNFTTTAGSSTDLVVHLPFDGSFADISGNKFDAVLGATAIADVQFVTDATRGEVVQFLAGSYAQLPKHDLLRPSDSQDFSVNLWVKLAGTDSDPVIIGNSDWGSGGNPGWLLCTDDGHEYAPGNGTDNGWQINLAGDPKADGNRMDWKAAQTTPQAPALSDDIWHMATIVLDQANKKLTVYIDGAEFGDSSNPSSFDLSTLTGPLYDVANDYPVTIWEDGTGAYNAGDDRRAAMTGLMDELKIYNKALTVDEITALFAN